MNKIPVVLISGFLGSGKTTLLLRLLEYAAKRQWRTAVLMNEMGEQDVDGDTVSNQIPDLPIEKRSTDASAPGETSWVKHCKPC